MNFFLVLLLCVYSSVSIEKWDLPSLPSNYKLNETLIHEKLIPRNLWIAVRDSNYTLSYQMPKLFERNALWNINIVTNRMKDKFMNESFANTSLLWAYHLISPKAGAAKADLWRYAVLWMYGGVYIDDDSDIGTPLDQMVEINDTLIVSYEKNGFNANRCYIPRYHLSDFSTFKNESKRTLEVFHNRCLLNWALAASPRHPVITHVINNAIEIIKMEYFQNSVLRSLNQAYRWEAIMCTTGPSLFTASARELILQEFSNISYRLVNVDFKDYGGRFKAVYVPVRKDPSHYMNMGHKRGKEANLLSEYLPETPITIEMLKQWQGQPIQGQNGKEIFVVDNCTRRGIPNFDTFLALNYTMADVIVVSDTKLSAIKLGQSMPSTL